MGDAGARRTRHGYRRYADQTSVGALAEFDGIVEDIITSPVALFSQKPGLCHKKGPQAVYALGVPEWLPQLRLLLGWATGCRGMGCRPVGPICTENKSAPRGYNAERSARQTGERYASLS